MSNTPHKIIKTGYKRYYYRGHRIEHTNNLIAFPCFRWGIWDGPLAGRSAFSLRGAKALIDAEGKT